MEPQSARKRIMFVDMTEMISWVIRGCCSAALLLAFGGVTSKYEINCIRYLPVTLREARPIHGTACIIAC